MKLTHAALLVVVALVGLADLLRRNNVPRRVYAGTFQAQSTLGPAPGAPQSTEQMPGNAVGALAQAADAPKLTNVFMILDEQMSGGLSASCNQRQRRRNGLAQERGLQRRSGYSVDQPWDFGVRNYVAGTSAQVCHQDPP